MKIPKEYAEKVKRYIELKEECGKLFAEVANWLNEVVGDEADIGDIFITAEPLGEPQDDDTEYCCQYTGYCADDYYGTYYHKIEGSEEYVGYSYHC